MERMELWLRLSEVNFSEKMRDDGTKIPRPSPEPQL